MTYEKNSFLLHHKILTPNFSVPRQMSLSKKNAGDFSLKWFFVVIYSQGGEVVQETITSNIHDDIITLEFQRTDGTLITQLIDFRSVSIVNLFLFLSHSPPKGSSTLPWLLAPRNKLNLNVFIMIWMKVWLKSLFCFVLSSAFVDPRMNKKRFSGIVLSIQLPPKWMAAPCYNNDRYTNMRTTEKLN